MFDYRSTLLKCIIRISSDWLCVHHFFFSVC